MPSPGPEHLPFRPQMPSSPHGPRLLIILGLCLSVSQFLHLLLSGFSFKRLFKVAFEKDWLILMSMMHLLKEKQVASGANGKCQFQACICQLDCYQLVLLINISTNALFSSFCYWYREFGLSNFQSWNNLAYCILRRHVVLTQFFIDLFILVKKFLHVCVSRLQLFFHETSFSEQEIRLILALCNDSCREPPAFVSWRRL